MSDGRDLKLDLILKRLINRTYYLKFFLVRFISLVLVYRVIHTIELAQMPEAQDYGVL